MLTILSDTQLIEAYYEARALGLEVEFLRLLAKEMERRGISLEQDQERNNN